MLARASEHGFTLIETIITIAIIAIAMTGIITVWSNAVSHSSDPYWQSKTATLGSIYLNQAQRIPAAKIKDYQGPAYDFNNNIIAGYEEFNITIETRFAANDFKLAHTLPPKSLIKVSIRVSHPQATDQQFVVYKQTLTGAP